MNVLSLFDGISCARVALDRADIVVNRYYASEVDKYAVQISHKNYPDIVRLGDITKINFKSLGKIDLLIGGSPCQGFSFAGKQLNFNDPRSKLFFEFVRAFKECKPKYFLLENVKMKKEYQDVISKDLGVLPIEINSSLVSAQNRKRLYWTNIKGVDQPKDKGIVLKDILEQEVDDKYYLSEKLINGFLNSKSVFRDRFKPLSENEKSYCLTARYYKMGKTDPYIITNKGLRKLTPVECERLQTLPDNYTEGVSNTQRYKSLGNGFTVDIIAHILNQLSGKAG